MLTNIRAACLATAAVTIWLGLGLTARADDTYFHLGRHAMADFSAVNAYEATQSSVTIANVTPPIQYFSHGRSAPPDFRAVNAYEAENTVPPEIVPPEARYAGVPDFNDANHMRAQYGSPTGAMADWAGRSHPPSQLAER